MIVQSKMFSLFSTGEKGNEKRNKIRKIWQKEIFNRNISYFLKNGIKDRKNFIIQYKIITKTNHKNKPLQETQIKEDK